jgi:hypothetical protein
MLPLFGQAGYIKGRIIDKQTKELLIGAAVLLDNTTIGSVSDVYGEFVIPNISSGKYKVTGSYISYLPQTMENVVVTEGDTTTIIFALNAMNFDIAGVDVVARLNRESENILLLDQKKAMIATRQIGVAELSRKGMGDAESAVSAVAGVSKQDGVKNVFVRGLGDRYNATLLNGMPVPSEDPEYKNIALSFFEADIIKNIGVDKVFGVDGSSDVGGAIIDIRSKELNGDYSFGVSVSGGVNMPAVERDFKQIDGFNYFGVAKLKQPARGSFGFGNKLDPTIISLPVNESYRISGGRKIDINNNPLNIYAVASHSSDFSFTREQIRNSTTAGMVYQDQTGKKYGGRKSQLALANINYMTKSNHSLSYNFMMLHSTNYYLGEYLGRHSEKFQDAFNDNGYLRRQQVNDNRLFSHQLLTNWTLSDRFQFGVNGSFNQINGHEPDRRENYLSQKEDGTYGLTGSNRQKRFFSGLDGSDFNYSAKLTYRLKDAANSENSSISVGYSGYLSETSFEASEFNFSAAAGSFDLDNLLLDDIYNRGNFDKGLFAMAENYPSTYSVDKNNHSFFLSGLWQFNKSWSTIVGLKYDMVDMSVTYDVPGQTGTDKIDKSFLLPSLHLKYGLDDKNIFRLGFSKTYTLPQSKEISPYQYVNIGFTSEGNPNLSHSDNYNFDLKWEFYPASSELVSAALFYKRIVNPIGKVDKGNSAGLLTYDNIGDNADVAGVEIELRKKIFSRENVERSVDNNLSLGFNFSYIHTATTLKLANTPQRTSKLEGASPFIVNADLTYRCSKADRDFSTSLVLNYFSDRIYTVGTMGYDDIMEKGVPTLDLVVAGKVAKRLGLKIKAANILDPDFKLTRDIEETGNTVTLNSFKKGMNLSMSLSWDL